jgi:hypothetical protein
MGIMECSKKDCENILCSRYSEEFGYLCSSCFSELSDEINKNPSHSLMEIQMWLDKPKRKDWMTPMVNLEKLFILVN